MRLNSAGCLDLASCRVFLGRTLPRLPTQWLFTGPEGAGFWVSSRKMCIGVETRRSSHRFLAQSPDGFSQPKQNPRLKMDVSSGIGPKPAIARRRVPLTFRRVLSLPIEAMPKVALPPHGLIGPNRELLHFGTRKSRIG